MRTGYSDQPFENRKTKKLWIVNPSNEQKGGALERKIKSIAGTTPVDFRYLTFDQIGEVISKIQPAA